MIKHTNPCGAAIGDSAADAYVRARDADSLAAFGGIVALNRPIDVAAAEAIVSTFIEAVIAPAVDPAAREILAKKANMRVVTAGFDALTTASTSDRFSAPCCRSSATSSSEAQRPWTPASLPEGLRVVTQRQPTAEEWEALRFAWRVCAHVKSNTVIFTDARRTLAIGAGQMSRVDAVNVAVMKAQAAGRSLSGSVAASDAFFPFRDGFDAVAKAGATAVDSAGRVDARRGGHRRGGRTRDGDGVHRPAAFPTLNGPRIITKNEEHQGHEDFQTNDFRDLRLLVAS